MFRLPVAVFVLLIILAPAAGAQSLQARADEIRAAMDARDFERAERLVRDLRGADAAAFTRNNYDYLLARLDERIGGFLNGRHTGIRRTYHGRAQEVRSQHSTAGADRKQ